MASTTRVAMASNPLAMASSPIAMASNLIAMAWYFKQLVDLLLPILVALDPIYCRLVSRH